MKSLRELKLQSQLIMILLTLTGLGRAALIHEYTFEGNANDQVGSANGTLINGAAASNGMLSLNGVNQYVQFGSHIVPTSGSYSVALFAQETTPVAGDIEFISQGSTYAPGFYIGHNGTSPEQIRVTDSWQNTSVLFPSNGLWNSYVVVVNASTSQSLLYVDGDLASTLNTAITTTTGADDTRLGRQFDPFGEYLAGNLANVQIYNNALTKTQVAAYATEGPTSSPEPASLLLFSIGSGIVLWVRHKRSALGIGSLGR